MQAQTQITQAELELAELYFQQAQVKYKNDYIKDFQSKNYLQEALQEINKSLRLQQNNVNAYLLRGEILSELENNEMALQDCNIVLKIDSKSANAYYLRCKSMLDYQATIQWKNKCLYSALDDINQAISLNPNFEIAYSRKGIFCQAVYQRNNSLGARTQFRSIYLFSKGDSSSKFSQQSFCFIKMYLLYVILKQFQNNKMKSFIKLIKLLRQILMILKLIQIEVLQCINQIAKIFLLQNKVNEALADYAVVTNINPYFIQPYIKRAKILIDQNQIEDALKEIRKAQNHEKNNAEIYYIEGNCYQKIGKLDMALHAYNRAITFCPKDEQYLNQRSELYFRLERFEEAIKDLNKAININSNSQFSYYNRAQSYLKIGQKDQAMKDLEKHVEINPNHSDAYYQLGFILTMLGNINQAFFYYCKAIQLNPKFQKAYANRGIDQILKVASLATSLGLKQQAFDDLNKAIELDPNCSNSYYNRGFSFSILGTLFVNLGNFELALKDLNQAIQIDPNYQDALNNRGLVYNHLGQKKEALKDFNQIILLNPTNGAVLNNIGTLQFYQGLRQDSLQSFLKANQYCQNPVILVNIGNIYFEERMYQQARNYLLQAKQLMESQGNNSKNCWNLSPANISALNEKVSLLLRIEEQMGSLRSQIMQKQQILNEQQPQLPSVDELEMQIFKDSKGQSIIQPITSNQDTCQVQRELSLLKQKTQYLQGVFEKIKLSDTFKIERGIEILNLPENSHKLLYFRSLVWHLYNYLNSMQQISTGFYEIKESAYKQNRFEQFIYYLKETIKYIPSVMKYLSLPSTVFDCINQALGIGMKKTLEITFKNRIIKITNILKRSTIGSLSIEQQIQLAALELSSEIKPQQQQQRQQSKFQKFVDMIANLSRQQEEFSQDIFWKKGIDDSLTILSYMNNQINPIENNNQTLSQIIIDAFRNNQPQQLQSS
ncbi:unnamed protein product (macronuclear) [Paramecium tetraurelia]|uniref:Tetratricopeptide repeat protein n=1 Tax=Paramecium tetraurelia TaxID=5888 RepID=A0DXT7_PARTE|nr:uncharacterized protein GSPATT00021478001 [Paramecium tetraurelia]CAK87854.1 unnamed protein product [Paramecium tetraurelia]|eukprot:XP_001455251.1 hypothetical protein (macronuclear) [Paramecium tetraurelia strain d4-2]